MYVIMFCLPFILPTLLSIILLCVRGKGRRIVPLLSIIFNIALYVIMIWSPHGQTPAFRLPFKFMNYPYVCVAVLFIGLVVEMGVRAAGRWSKPTIAGADRPPMNSCISMVDIVTLCVVLTSPMGIIDPRMISSLVWYYFILLAASQLQGLKTRWIMIIFWLYGCLQLVYFALSLAYNPEFRAVTGFRLPQTTIQDFIYWAGWYSLIAHVTFGFAFYSLCKKFKAHLMALGKQIIPSINSADGTSALPGDQLAEPPRLCAEKAPTLIDIDVNG